MEGPARLVRIRLTSRGNFLPSAGGQESAHTCADETEGWRKYCLSFVAGTDDGIVGAIIIDGRAKSKAGTRADGAANERVAQEMPATA